MSRSSRVYRWLLRLYGRGLPAEHGDEMAEAVDEMIADARRRGCRWPRLRVWGRLVGDLLATVPRELRDRHLPRSATRRRRRDAGDPVPMETLLQDVRFALRVLRREPLFTLVASFTVALGIAATATIFSIANGLLLQSPEGVVHDDDLVTLHRVADDGSGFHAFSVVLYRHLAAADVGLDELAATDTFAGALRVDDATSRVAGTVVSANYFDALGTRPGLGRFFRAAEDEVPGRDLVVVIGDRLWRERLDADPDVVGRQVTLNGRAYTVVGVAEPGFTGHLAIVESQLWVPLAAQGVVRGRADLSEEAAGAGLELLGRLREGVSVRQVEDAIDRAAVAFQERRGAEWFGVDVFGYSPVLPMARDFVVMFLTGLFAVAGVLLTVTAVNVANMLLSRGATREREVSVRRAIGATRRRLVTQLLTESVLLFLLGGVLGVLMTYWGTALIAGFELPFPGPANLDFSPDLRVLAFALAVAAITGIAFGMWPALRSTDTDLVSGLKEGPSSSRRRGRLQSALVVVQVAGSAVLLVAAGLLVRSMGAAADVDLGIDPEGVYAMDIDTSASGAGAEEGQQYLLQALRAVRELPAVGGAALIDVPPLSGSNQQSFAVLPDRPQEPGDGQRRVEFAAATPGYFETMEIALLAGRGFRDTDVAGAPAVVVVNEAFARSAWPDQDPVGRRLGVGSLQSPTPAEVVGVTATTKIRTPGESPRPMVYVSWEQFPDTSATLVVEVETPLAVAAIRERILELDPTMPPVMAVAYEDLVGLSMLPSRLAAMLAGAFGVTGLILAAVGLYGLLALSVVRRSREIGVRLALGSGAGQVRRLVVRDGLRLTAIGLAVGLALAAGVGQLLRGLLFGVGPLDPVTFGVIAATLLLVAFLACWIPARRAAATDPVRALRAD